MSAACTRYRSHRGHGPAADPETASLDYIQFGEQDEIILIPFDGEPRQTIPGSGQDQQALLRALYKQEAAGSTNIYAALRAACELLEAYDPGAYTLSVVLMTDGQSWGDIQEFAEVYEKSAQPIGVYSITFGNADPSQLESVAALTGGKVFNGKTDLTEAFRTVRAINERTHDLGETLPDSGAISGVAVAVPVGAGAGGCAVRAGGLRAVRPCG